VTEPWPVIDQRRSFGWQAITRNLSTRRTVILIVIGLLTGWVIAQSIVAAVAYSSARGEAGALRSDMRGGFSGLSDARLTETNAHLGALEADLHRLDRATSIPLVGGIVEHVPIVGPRYQATRKIIAFGISMTSAGQEATALGHDALSAFDATGASADIEPGQPTWLDVLTQRQDDIARIGAQIEVAKAQRATIRDNLVPGRVRSWLHDLDPLLSMTDYAALTTEDLPSLVAALGNDKPTRYLVLFQNSEEMRPAGGFPGTMGIVTVERGQVRSWEVFNAHSLSEVQFDQRKTVLPQPFAMETYIPTDGLFLHDANWWADFPTSARTIMQMYSETDWPPIDGVIAIEPAVIGELLRVTGTLSVDVDGVPRKINAGNFVAEIERQRLLRSEGDKTAKHHKEVLELIGQQIVERLKATDRRAMPSLARRLKAAADRRDIQIYTNSDAINARLAERQWNGAIQPGPDIPSLAVTFANLVTNKASGRMQPSMSATIGPAENGQRQVKLDITATHTGPFDPDPNALYTGFQRWWVDVYLPEGATLVSADPLRQPAPDAPDGGSYLIEIFPEQERSIALTFSMPATDRLTLRRQPGLTTMQVHIAGACSLPDPVNLTTDVVLDLAAVCRQ
jgi:hypothetical protein